MSIKRWLVSLLLALNMIIVPVLAPATAYAATAENCGKSSRSFLGFPTWYKYLNPTFSDGECKIDFDIQQDIGKVLLAIFEITLRIAGLIAVIFLIVGGFQYLTSQGEPEQLKGARSTLLNAVIGLAIAMSATAIVNLVASRIA